MRPTLALLLALLCAPLATYAQPTPKPATVRDHLWLFACPPGGDAEYLENAGYRGGSRMTPVEGAHWLGIPNLVFVMAHLGHPWEGETLAVIRKHPNVWADCSALLSCASLAACAPVIPV